MYYFVNEHAGSFLKRRTYLKDKQRDFFIANKTIALKDLSRDKFVFILNLYKVLESFYFNFFLLRSMGETLIDGREGEVGNMDFAE